MPIWSAEIKELERLYESFKGQLPDLEKELERLLKTGDENIILVYARRCLEVIITDLCECELKRPRKTEPLKGIIDKLNKEEKVPSNIITSMDHLNSLSAYGAHPKDFDPEQVKPVLNNLYIIIKWYLRYKDIQVKIKIEEETQVKIKQFENLIKEKSIEQLEKSNRFTKHKLLYSVLIITILIIAVIVLAYPKIFKDNKLRYYGLQNEISIAVMPFQNMTGDESNNFWQEMVQDILITSLSNSEKLKIRQTESINTLLNNDNVSKYSTITSITPSIARNVSQKLEADVFVYGSINKSGDKIRINAKLIDSGTEEVFKSFPIDGLAENIINITDSLSFVIKDYLISSLLKKETSPDWQSYAGLPKSSEALRYFLDGRKLFLNSEYAGAMKMFHNAIEIDSNYTNARIMLAFTYLNAGLFGEAKKWSLKAYNSRDKLSRIDRILTEYTHAWVVSINPSETIKNLKQLLEIDDKNAGNYWNLGSVYYSIHQYDKAITEFETALTIYDNWGIKPMWVYNYTALGEAYDKTGQYKKEKKLYKKAEKDFPDDPFLLFQQATLAVSEGKTRAANEYIEKYVSALKEKWSVNEAGIAYNLGRIYKEAEIPDKAEEYYQKALSLEPENPDRLNNLAYFLIDTERNITEGLELVEKALEFSPDNYDYLHTKGWGLYKDGKYKEALELLKKSWDLRREQSIYDHEAFLHFEAAKKAIASQKNN